MKMNCEQAAKTRETVRALKNKGLTFKEISYELNISYEQAIYYINHKDPKRISHNELYKKILEDSKTMKQSEIVNKYGVSRQYVSWVINHEKRK